MRRWRAWSIALVLLAFGGLVGPGCSGGGGGSSGGASCQSGSDCTQWRCTCNDGSSMSISECIMNKCPDSNQVCGGACKNNGGLKSATPAPNVAKSAECDAYCAKVASLHCSSYPTCDRSFDCSLSQGECAAQKRAQLQCEVDTGTWSCDNGNFSVSSGCASAQCPAEAGASDAGTD